MASVAELKKSFFAEIGKVEKREVEKVDERGRNRIRDQT